MTANLTCTQVSALLSFYIDDKLSIQLKQFVESHLQSCPNCRTKYETLQTMVTSLREVHTKLADVKPDSQEAYENPQYNEFKINLSAYVDNELSDTDNIKIKKYIVSNPKARQELESMYKLKKAMNVSFEKAKTEAKDDFSKYILRRIDIQEEVYAPDSFAKVVALFILILTILTVTAVIIFWV